MLLWRVLYFAYCIIFCLHVHGRRGVYNFTAYIDNMTKLLATYQNDAKALAKQGNKDKLQTLLTKKKLVEKEVNNYLSKLNNSEKIF